VERGYNLNIRTEKIDERSNPAMDIATYFGMIVYILIGLTFIALVFAFLYMVYGEKEEAAPSSAAKLSSIIRRGLMKFLLRLPVMFWGNNF